MIITCVAILAVDFRVFPRRFAKVENWGTSLMDMGVGSFVFTAGVVSVRSSLKEGARQPTSLSKRLAASFRHALPLLVLGIIRLISVKGLDYAEHVTEYGVHWNFFFTLGCLPPFAALFQSAFALLPSYALLSFVLAAVYEMALDLTSLGPFILIAPRNDLFSKNREGIFSFVGYLAIFLAGQSLGSIALPRQQQLPKTASNMTLIRQSTLGKLALLSVAWTVLFYLSTSHYGLRLSVSRRLANLPYVLWVSSFNSYQITICCAIETLLFPNLYKAPTKDEEKARSRDATSTVLYAFNRNGLAIFLVANLLTGLVNMTMPTLHMSVLQSIAVLVVYTSIVTIFAVALDLWNISIKLWKRDLLMQNTFSSLIFLCNIFVHFELICSHLLHLLFDVGRVGMISNSGRELMAARHNKKSNSSNIQKCLLTTTPLSELAMHSADAESRFAIFEAALD